MKASTPKLSRPGSAFEAVDTIVTNLETNHADVMQRPESRKVLGHIITSALDGFNDSTNPWNISDPEDPAQQQALEAHNASLAQLLDQLPDNAQPSVDEAVKNMKQELDGLKHNPYPNPDKYTALKQLEHYAGRANDQA